MLKSVRSSPRYQEYQRIGSAGVWKGIGTRVVHITPFIFHFFKMDSHVFFSAGCLAAACLVFIFKKHDQ